MRLAILAALPACAAVTSTCPTGTKPVGGKPPIAHARYCMTASSPTGVVPMAGRTFDSTLGIGAATEMNGGVAGPYTSYYADGALESHGTYEDYGARSVPNGIWGFWYPNGRRRTLGEYKRGIPTGCFAVWDDAGTQRTGFVEGTDLRVAPCTPPPEDVLLAAEGRSPIEAASPRRADFSLLTFLGGGAFGARSANQIDPDPSMDIGFLAVARLHLGPIRVGPMAGVRTGAFQYSAIAFGATATYALPSPHPRLDLELGLDLAADRITATAIRPGEPGDAELVFWTPIAAVHATAALALTPALDAVVGLRVDGGPPRDILRSVTYCDFLLGCAAPQQETWQLGGVTYGIAAGLRLNLR